MLSQTSLQQFFQNALRSKSNGHDEAVTFDKRRWMSFLTWAFVLAEMVGRDAFLPTAAHAGDDDASQTGHHGSDTAPIANNLPDVDVSTATEGPDPISYPHAAQMQAYAADAIPSELMAAKEIPVADLGANPHFGGYGGGGGGGGGGSAASASGDGATNGEPLGHSLASLLDQPLVAAVGHDGSLIDLGLHSDLSDTAHNLLGAVSASLGSLPLVGDTLEGLGDFVGKTAGTLLSPLEPVASLIGIGDSEPHHFGNDLGLPGQLQFSSGNDPSVPTELVSTHGNYTSYGIALSVGTSHDAVGSADASVHSDASDQMLDIHIADDLPGSGLHVGSDALHLDQAILRTAADVLA